MKKRITTLVCMLAVLATGREAQAASSASANATATIATPIAITNTAALAFGTIVPGASAGTVTIGQDGVLASSNVTILASTHSAASFTVTGETNALYSATLPTNGTVTISNGVQTMAINNFTSSSGRTLIAGTSTLTVGGTLSVGAAQAAGAYTGTFSVDVAYN